MEREMEKVGNGGGQGWRDKRAGGSEREMEWERHKERDGERGEAAGPILSIYISKMIRGKMVVFLEENLRKKKVFRRSGSC